RPTVEIRHRDARALAHGYSRGIRRLEVGSITALGVLMGLLLYRLAPYVGTHFWLLLSAVAVGYVGADFVSGFVHWMADTWGSVDTPFIGKALIRPFREHHVDQKAITRHDFVETNGNNCLICLPVISVTLLLPLGPDRELSLFASAFVVSLLLWVFGTNQFHKWAHLERPPRGVRWLQKTRLILSPEHHAVHHRAPYSSHYAITSGWVNGPLAAVRFYPRLEALVTRLTGALPRRDDLGERAARNAAEMPPEGRPEQRPSADVTAKAS
ncbi:MAG TPA: fatty acid desaturase family protein, partial [Myxococcaceae bacterium]|nr:fatty acid desaturase family protein [Myxococcaceae bacterium]